MDMFERIRLLRKEHLRLSQTEFGERLGVSRSVINNIERNVLAKPEQKQSLLKLMCKEFRVREEWLFEGKGEIFEAPDGFVLEEYLETKSVTALEKQIIQIYFELDVETRTAFLNHFAERLKARETIDDEVEAYRKELQANIDEKVEAYRQELEQERKGETSSPYEDTEENVG